VKIDFAAKSKAWYHRMYLSSEPELIRANKAEYARIIRMRKLKMNKRQQQLQLLAEDADNNFEIDCEYQWVMKSVKRLLRVNTIDYTSSDDVSSAYPHTHYSKYILRSPRVWTRRKSFCNRGRATSSTSSRLDWTICVIAQCWSILVNLMMHLCRKGDIDKIARRGCKNVRQSKHAAPPVTRRNKFAFKKAHLQSKLMK